ncbi:hypothetical protein BWR18_18435 [Tateyamaria omphalii]|uniref:NACHT domain-containing protein n=1 Tax=Tateyamaria omphalii TaxID=299262 RepID=A0A1P8MZC8_9RHOB|nr:hypothetical protein BWR18_18435 [Tateyamaria omphalii]
MILGAGGGGKSMFMRYLWLSYFEKPDGLIPFFLELRHLNNFTHNNIEDFIYHSITKSGSQIRQDEFNRALRNGEFILFLDGFDEINFDRRQRFQDLILQLKNSNPKLCIVLTSRPDERFMGWDDFSVAKVEALDEERSKLLIERADYDADLKSKFLQRFESLFSAHQDFLSNPLLAYMMLVSFSYNPDIPKRMFQFYEQAFEALYHRHDLTKGYKRIFHCDLDKFDFLRLTAYFCLKTYYDEQIEFTRSELLDAINQAQTIEAHQVSSEHFLDDLTISVCLLKLEGLTYTFTHRSFQEYFAAYCIARVASRNIEEIFSKFAARVSDSVLPMVADINPDLFREKYVIPNTQKFKSLIDRKTDAKIYESFSARTGSVFTIHLDKVFSEVVSKRKQKRAQITLRHSGEMADFYYAIRSVASNQGWARHDSSTKDDMKFERLALKKFEKLFDRIFVLVEANRIRISSSESLADNQIPPDDEAGLVDAFKQSRMHAFIVEEAKIFIAFVKQERKAYKSVSGAFSDLF